MSRVLCLGRSSRTLLAFVAALVLCAPPGLIGQLMAQPHSAPAQADTLKSCCSKADGNHEACAHELAATHEGVRASCCHHSDSSKLPVKSCCGGMGGCGCSCCPSMIAVVPARSFEWSSPVLEQDCLHPSFALSSRRDVPPTPPPNVA